MRALKGRCMQQAPCMRHGPSNRHPFARQRYCCTRVMAAASSAPPPPVLLVNSQTGKMGQAVAEASIKSGLTVVPHTLCGPGDIARTGPTIHVAGQDVALVGPDSRGELLDQLKQQHPNLIVVDYTVPDVVNEMAELYIRHGAPFVMGTTGGDRAKLLDDVRAAGLYAVIAPQMGKQVVAFQAMMEMMAHNFPGAFAGYTLRVTESHQSSKKDTSGTAKAIVASFQGLGLDFGIDQIELVRDPEQQVSRMAVPQDALLGHAYHTYQLVSPDGTVGFEFQHNVCGRSIYAEGTVDAVLFLSKQIAAATEQKLFNMVDVLRAGAMR